MTATIGAVISAVVLAAGISERVAGPVPAPVEPPAAHSAGPENTSPARAEATQGPAEAAPEPAATSDPGAHDCADVPLRERLGQLIMVALPGVRDADHPYVTEAAAAGVGGIMLRGDNLTSLDQARELVTGLRARLGADLLVAVDDEGGRVRALRDIGNPVSSARHQGAMGPDAAHEAGRVLGADLAAIGADWVFAPVVDLHDGAADHVIGDRSYGADPAAVTTLAGAFAQGLREQGLAVTTKHYPGYGDAADTHAGTASSAVSLDELVARHLVPFEALAAAGAEATMISHVSYPNALGELPASINPATYQLLRTRGFDGVAITDALGMGAIHARWGFDVAPALAIDAGADMILVNQGHRVGEIIAGLEAAARDGRLDEARVDEANARLDRLAGRDANTPACPVR